MNEIIAKCLCVQVRVKVRTTTARNEAPEDIVAAFNDWALWSNDSQVVRCLYYVYLSHCLLFIVSMKWHNPNFTHQFPITIRNLQNYT